MSNEESKKRSLVRKGPRIVARGPGRAGCLSELTPLCPAGISPRKRGESVHAPKELRRGERGPHELRLLKHALRPPRLRGGQRRRRGRGCSQGQAVPRGFDDCIHGVDGLQDLCVFLFPSIPSVSAYDGRGSALLPGQPSARVRSALASAPGYFRPFRFSSLPRLRGAAPAAPARPGCRAAGWYFLIAPRLTLPLIMAFQRPFEPIVER